MADEKNYITPAGYKRLVDELTQLATVERPKVVREVSDAAAEGDRSENAAYIYGKRRLREIDRRIRFLSRRMESVSVVEALPDSLDEIRFGARVVLSGSGGRSMEIQLVGEDEIDPAKGRISLKSPLGSALIGRKVGQTVEVSTPRGVAAWTVDSIAY